MDKNLSQIFDDINKNVTVKNTNETAKNYEAVRDLIYNSLRESDAVFKTLACGHSLAGSYADRVKVSAPDEFDLLLHIKLGDGMVVRADKNKPGNVTINIKAILDKYNQPVGQHVYKKLKGMVDDHDYLLEPKIHEWFQSIFDKIGVNGTLWIQGKRFQIAYRRQGPAHTLRVKTDPLDFSIDFVPALQMNSGVWCAKRQRPKMYSKSIWWEAIPKKLSNDHITNRSNISWQASYAKMERAIINDRNRLKDGIRMLKVLRDTRNWQQFKSYFIKTIFLWECDVQKKVFWDQPLSDIVFHMLNKWLEYVDKGNLPFYWDDQCNLLARTKFHTMHDQLKQVIIDLEKYKRNNPEKIRGVFINEELIVQRESALRGKTGIKATSKDDTENLPEHKSKRISLQTEEIALTERMSSIHVTNTDKIIDKAAKKNLKLKSNHQQNGDAADKITKKGATEVAKKSEQSLEKKQPSFESHKLPNKSATSKTSDDGNGVFHTLINFLFKKN